MHYIPTQEERIKIYSKINTVQIDSQNNINLSNRSQHAQGKDIIKKISKDDVVNLVARLTKNSKRDYIVKQQIDKIRRINIVSMQLTQDKKKAAQNAQKVQERLIKAGLDLEQKKQKLREQQQKKLQASLQATPTISTRAKAKIDKPFIERVDRIISEKQQIMNQLNSKYQPLFKPQLNNYSLFLAEIHHSKNFLERVQQNKEAKQQLIKQKIQAKKEQEMKQATFHPQINQQSRSMALKQSKQSSQTNRSIKKNSKYTNQPNFKPQINKKSELIAKQRNNSGAQAHQRLYDDMKRISLKKLQKKRQIQQQHTYKPAINRKSLQILSQKLYSHSPVQTHTHLDSLSDQYEQIRFTKQKYNYARPSITTEDEDNQFLNFQNKEIKFMKKTQDQNCNTLNFICQNNKNFKSMR